jgi:hypothetical protein
VAAGEINDRYRNSNPTQGIGCTMGTLEGLFNAAEILRIAGFDPYAYRGAHNQSIEMATQYYACYGKYLASTRRSRQKMPGLVPTINNTSARSSMMWTAPS